MNIASLLQNVLVEEKTLCKSERSQLIKEMYELYTSDMERILRKKENWRRYVTFLKACKHKDTEEYRKMFKKGKTFIKEKTLSSFIFFTSHIPTRDLYYCKSVMKDCLNRGKSCNAWLVSNTRVIPK